MDRLTRKFDTARQVVPGPEIADRAGAEIGIIAYGSSHWAIDESRMQLEREAGLRTGYLRLRAYPFNDELASFIDRYKRIYVVEQNRDAQMLGLMRMELSGDQIARLRSVLHYSGMPIDARSVTDEIIAQEGIKPAPRREPLVATAVGVTRGE
jgi:2-oxoglutarate ferredoxin oxidoreductase subunit alpha